MSKVGIRSFLIVLLLIAGLALDASQASGSDRPSRRSRTLQLKGGVLATFEVQGEQFKVWIKNSEAIESVYALQAGTSTANIPNGRLRTGAGKGNHNAPWLWHLDPNDIEFADATAEVCDATPTHVQRNRNDFIREVGRYCPWLAELVALRDFR
jgi:hypothetical protein